MLKVIFFLINDYYAEYLLYFYKAFNKKYHKLFEHEEHKYQKNTTLQRYRLLS